MAAMDHALPLGRALRRFRRLHAIKQTHLAEMLGVSQGSVSRWESGTHAPDPAQHRRLLDLMATRSDASGDAALKRLIASSTARVHLVCDVTHRLLAASPGRAASWGADAQAYLGTSLWPYATPEIITAQDGLADSGWFERPFASLRFETGSNGSRAITIHSGTMLWESLPLADGRVGRLTTALG
ncbi:helix-turn-helix transcriptional regulator [Novosphingobium terrae]|uniref:helix-turn-helix transcriptional regulator n=1 Tax=Novosphingobium terrae TaxID=2726189 RepID=UPI00197E77BF|nr:helix-turn-helix transcriptional regulator [Novosphingobium terrae]